MGQLVGEQMPSRRRCRFVAAGGKDDVAPGRVSKRLDLPGGVGRLGIGMHPHPAEVMAETGFHELAGAHIERLA
ncbi:MAG: hypothetical protein MPW16_13035 [Candidatus Manganitrophus sp.]|nr:MAG: hypothetical protein MPW16_13035 [Candidatus Manganitrophus sp.]